MNSVSEKNDSYRNTQKCCFDPVEDASGFDNYYGYFIASTNKKYSGYRHIEYDTKENGIVKIDDNITFIKTSGKKVLTFEEWSHPDNVKRAHAKNIKKL